MRVRTSWSLHEHTLVEVVRILVTGGRHYDDAGYVAQILGGMRRRFGLFVLIHGGATGADQLAEAWGARNLGRERIVRIRAQWARLGSAAGPIRNGQMIDTWAPHYGVAFPGNAGTADCVKQMKLAGVPVYDFRRSR